MNAEPLVSIVIPTYNRAKIVIDAIQSAIAQTYPYKEIIVVDDGSTDETKTVVTSFPQVKYIFQDHSGQAVARNNGWRNSKGKYFSTLDSDDVWQPDFLEKCIPVLEKNNLDFVFSNWNQQVNNDETFDFFSCDVHLQPYLRRTPDSWIFLKYPQLRAMYLASCPSPSSSLVLRTSSIVDGWNPEMNIGDDWGMLLDIVLLKEAKVAFTTQRLWLKHVNSDNIYDGRNHIEVNKLLWVKDFKTMLARHKNSLTKTEYKCFEKRYLKNLVRSAKHSLFIYSKPLESLGAMKKALLTDPLYTSKIFSELFIEAAKRKLKSNNQ